MIAATSSPVTDRGYRTENTHRHCARYVSAVTMQCPALQARAICDGVAREQQYRSIDDGSGIVRYTRADAWRGKSTLPGLEVTFEPARTETTVKIVGYRRSTLQRLLHRKVSVRAEVVVFRDRLWCAAAQAQISATLR
jgi:hypothetical protein